MSRDRDVRNAIQAALVATGAFDPNAVWIWGLPEDYGAGASSLAAAAIEPSFSEQTDVWDDAPVGGLVGKSLVTITFLYRDDDAQLRDEACELLFDTAANCAQRPESCGLHAPGTDSIRVLAVGGADSTRAANHRDFLVRLHR